MPSWSGLANGVYGVPYATLTNTTGNTRTYLLRRLAQKKYGDGEIRALMVSLINGAVGANATDTHKRITALADLGSNLLGGKRVIETFTQINRNTVAADVTKLLANLSQSSQPSTYPRDRSGNGGGGKAGIL